MTSARWLGAVEGYYGPPLEPAARIDLLTWLAAQGFNCFAYAPKDDPYHRIRWREPYPAAPRAELRALVAHGRAVGIDVALVVSPGLDWTGSDHDLAALVAKLRSFADLGADVLGVAFDDVAPGGADLGATHGRAVAAAVAALPDTIRWISCPADYATAVVTPYLAAYRDALPHRVEVMWTGPSIVSPQVRGSDVDRIAGGLGRPPLFAENFPVNDGAMSHVLHLGPYPERAPEIATKTRGVFCNLMPRSLATRPGLAVAAAWWADPHGDREQQWRTAIGEFPGLLPLARSCRAWAGDGAGIDAELAEWAAHATTDDRLLDYLKAGARAGLDPGLAAEVMPWLDQWDYEGQAMQLAIALLRAGPRRRADLAFATAELWRRARTSPYQVFGVRWAYYPVTEWADGRFHALPGALVAGDNLTDRLCRRALTGG